MSKKVVVVDDDREFLNELADALREGGYITSAFSDGNSALSMIERIRPDVVVVDLKMDRVSGFQVADKLSSNRATAGIPIIAITGAFPEKEHSWAMTLCGIKKSLTKPFEPGQLMEEIEAVLNSKAS